MKINIQYDVHRPLEFERVIKPVPNCLLKTCNTLDPDDMWHVGTVSQIHVPIERKDDDEFLIITALGESRHYLRAYVTYFIEDGYESEDDIKYDKFVQCQRHQSKLSENYHEYPVDDNILKVVYDQLKKEGIDIFKLLIEFRNNVPVISNVI